MPALPLGVTPKQGLLAVAAGLLGAAAFPPLTLYPAILVSIAGLCWLLRDTDAQTARNLGVVYGGTFGLATMYWFFAVFGFLTVPLIGLMAIYFALFAWCVAVTRGMRPLLRVALVAVFAVGIEWLRGDAWYLRFPWYTPPHALAASPTWIADARWLGVYGLSFLTWFIAAAGAFLNPACWFAFALLPLGSLLLPPFEAPDRRALLVQAEGEVETQMLLPQLPTEKVDLVVLPEYSFTSSVRSVLASQDGPRKLARATGCPVVFGAIEGGEYGTLNFSNVAAVIDAEGRLLGTFPKQHPVPLMLDGTSGKRRPIFQVNQGILGVAVCYDFDAPEVAASLVAGGATVLVAPTFDAMSWTRIQHVHHELLVRLRALETDRWVLRAVSSGRTQVINPHGVPSQEGIEIGEKGYITLPYAHRTTTTLGAPLHLLGPLCAIAAGVFVLFQVLIWLRQRAKLRHMQSRLVEQ
jgi:apolipoprotein N-acyltransferase